MSDEFTRRIFRVVLAKAAESREFTGICETTLEILIDVVLDRLFDLGRSAASISCHCGRTDTNGLDVFAALERYRETPESLATHLRRPDQFPPFDYLVDPYPLPRLPGTYGAAPADRVPFRANSTFAPGRGHIPPFFPPFPRRPADGTADVAGSGLSAAEEARRAEAQALGQLSAGRGTDRPHTVRFDSELTKLMTGDLLSKPAAVLRSPIFLVEGAPARPDPEMLALRESGQTAFFSTQTNDVEAVLQPLTGNKRRDGT
jgi:hypothetical protein